LPKLFGTDGIRGVANAALTPEQALRVGRAGADFLARDPERPEGRASLTSKPFLVLGRDTRLSGDLLSAAIAAGCCSVGVDIVDAGTIPTPGVAFLTRHLGASGGVVISASHNPVDDNGIKFFDACGYKLTPEAEAAIESKVLARRDRLPRPTGAGVGRLHDGRDEAAAYADHLVSVADPTLEGLKVVVDAAFGATARLATAVLRRAGAEVVPLNDVHDGARINVDCGSTNPALVCEVVLREKASAGLAFDGDGDRVIACDERGSVVDGDQILAILALDLMSRRALPGKTVVATVMSNLGLDLALREAGGKVVRTPVGDRNVLGRMLESGFVLGGEQSGHIIYLEHNTTGDGIAASLAVLSVLARTGRPLSEIAGRVSKLPQILINVEAASKDRLQTSERVATAIERVRERLGHTGRVLVRPSGTEPVVRIMVEGRSAGCIEQMARELAAVVAEELGGEVRPG